MVNVADFNCGFYYCGENYNLIFTEYVNSEWDEFRSPMPEVCISVWQKIWSMTSKEFSSARCYLADFEVYDSRAADPTNTVLDVYVGIN